MVLRAPSMSRTADSRLQLALCFRGGVRLRSLYFAFGASNQPPLRRIIPPKAVWAAYGPRKESNSPKRFLQFKTLTSSPRGADAGHKWKEGVYARFKTAATRIA